MPRLRPAVPLGCLFTAACVFAIPAASQTEITGTKSGSRPQEIQIPPDARPAFSFVNKTGARICDFIITRSRGAANITAAILDDPRISTEDWDVDDNRDGDITDANEGSVAPAAEGAGAAALAHQDNMQPANQQVRLEEDGLNTCVERNSTFEITLQFDATPTIGDEMTLQPTNGRGSNIYAWVGGLTDEQHFAMVTDAQIGPTFAAWTPAVDTLISSVAVTLANPELTLADLSTTPAGEVDLAAGTVSFAEAISAAEGVLIEGSTTAFGEVALTVNVASAAAGPPFVLLAVGIVVLIVIGFAVLRRGSSASA